MNPLILLVNQFKKLGDTAKIEAYLDLQKKLLEFTGLKADDSRLSMSVRKEGDISININSRRVLALRLRQKTWRIQIMINDDDLAEARQFEGYLSREDEAFSNRIGVPATLIRFELDTKPYQNNRLMQLWETSVLDYLPTASGTPYRKEYNGCLLAATMNNEARQQLYNWMQQEELTEKDLESDEIKKLFNLDDSRITPSVSDSNFTQNDKNMPTFPLNQILYGPPGTGKTYHTINKALAIIENKTEEELEIENRKALKKRFDDYVTEGSIVFTTFHQSMSYEDFIEGIKPLKPLPDDKNIKYDIQDGIFKRFCNNAKSNYENSKIENKNKLSFEDTFETLKEEWDKNNEMSFSLKTDGYDFTIIGFTEASIQFKKSSGGTGHTLSINSLKELYYGKNFNFKQGLGIYYAPILKKLDTYNSYKKGEVLLKPFVLIIDEINRGNVSQIFGELITLIEEDKRLGKDEALTVTLPYSKEKFGVPSNVYIIGTMNTADRSVEALDTALRRRFSFVEMPPQYHLDELDKEIGGFYLPDILQTINDRIEVLLNRDNLIGHSYFLKVDSEEALKETMFKNIIPLLQEYFFGDYGKIGLVLGKGFVKEEKERKKVSFATFDYPDTEGVQKTVYELRKYDEVDIEKAIKWLLNGKA